MKKTKFGANAIGLQTPQWAKWVFRIFMSLTTVAAFIIANDPRISDQTKVIVGVYLKAADMLVFGFSKMFGIVENK